MMLKTCSRKNNPAKSFFLFSLKKQTPFALLLLAVTLIVSPGTLLRQLLQSLSRLGYVPNNDMEDYFAGYSIYVFIISVVLMLILLMVNFSFLFNKKAGDMFHALPLTRNELFFIRALSAYVGALFNMTAGFLGLVIVNCLPLVNPVEPMLVVTTYLMMVLFLTMLTAFSLVFIVVSGGYFDFIIALGAVNGGVPALASIFINFFENCADGLSVDFSSIIYTTPFAYTVYKLGAHADNYGEANMLNIDAFSVWSVIVVAIITIFCIAVCSKLFKIRKSETAGEAYSFKFVPPIISILIAAVGGYLVGFIVTFNSFESFDFWLFFVLGALICSIAFGAIATRGFKTVKPSLIRGGISIALTLVIAMGVSSSAKSAAVYVPKTDEISKIELYNYGAIEFKDNFDVITEMHSQIVENIKNNYHDEAQKEPDIIGNIDTFMVRYTLKNGKSVARDYYYHQICRDNLYDDMLAIMKTDEFMSKYYSAASSAKGFVTLTSYEYKGYEGQSVAIVHISEAKELVATYQKEMSEADLSIFGEECLRLYIESDRHEALYIPTSFDETLSFLEGRLTPDNEFYNK